MAKRAVDIFFVYQFVKRLATPFDETKAYEYGIIDDEGNVIRDTDNLTPEEKKHFTYFDKLVFNIKRLLLKVPGFPDNKLANVGAAMFLLKEEASLVDAEQVLTLASNLDQQGLNESAAPTVATNGPGGGAMNSYIAPVDPKDQPKFGNTMVFRVDSNTFHNTRQKNPHERYSKFVSPGDQLDRIRSSAKKYPGKSILLQDENTGAYTILKFGKQRWG